MIRWRWEEGSNGLGGSEGTPPPPPHTDTHTQKKNKTQKHAVSPRQTLLIAIESQTGVIAAAVSTDNSTETNIGLKCLMAGTPGKWKGWELCELGCWRETKRGFVFSDFQLVFVPVKKKKGRLFWWGVNYLHCAAAVDQADTPSYGGDALVSCSPHQHVSFLWFTDSRSIKQV